MEEARHAWSSFKSVGKLSSSRGNGDTDNSTTIWYDVPVPVIIHCHEFPDANEANKPKVTAATNDANAFGAVDQDRRMMLADSPETERDKETKFDLYANESLPLDTERSRQEKRHRNTVELTAITSVKTDRDGVPSISFSFVHADEKLPRTSEIDGRSSEGRDASTSSRNQLYDFPKSSYIRDENETEKVIESRDETDADGNEIQRASQEEVDAGSIDVPRKMHGDAKEPRDALEQEKLIAREKANDRTIAKTDLPAKRLDRRAIRSARSLRSERKSYGMSEGEYDGDAGIASMSGSYSDPECSNEPPSNVSRRNRHSKLQKHRLGKAWDKMTSWIRDETSKINEIVIKHARLQAVGALAEDARVPRVAKSKSTASYDLTKARTQELGSITRVEEFGLAAVSEANVTSSPESAAVSMKNIADDADPNNDSRKLRRKVGSSDNVFNVDAKKHFAPVSFSMDKLCFDTENEEVDGDGDGDGDGDAARDHVRKAGPIKKRMLGSIRGLMASTHLLHVHETEEGGQGGFEDVRRFVKQGGDFCKELASILHERAELEATYAKGLTKLSNKLTKACTKDQGGNSGGGVNEAWRCVGEEMEAAAEAHRLWGITLDEQIAKPLRVGVAEAQGRSRKSVENSVDKAGKSLHEWRNVATKSKKQSFACARENERLQDLARLQSISQSQQSNNKSSNHHMTEKEANKLEARRRKAEDSSRRADTEFYTVSVRAERARLEYESTVKKGVKQMELLEEERLSALKDLANVYLAHLQALAPRLQQNADRLAGPVRSCNVSQDVEILKNLIRRVESNDGCNSEQLLPDFYAEHVTLAMNRERRKQALVRVLHLIRQDLERERRGREGLETLHRAFIATPAFAADESTQNVTEKLHHMRSMLLYLQAARYKVGGTLAEVEGSKRGKHPLSEHILVSRDKQGLQQSVLKVPSWAKNESFEFQDDEDEIEVHLAKDHETESRHWADRTAGDGNSENPPDEDDFSDFDEFSSHSEDNNNSQDVDVVETTSKTDGTEQCRAIYQYSANLNDELSLSPGDLITVHQKQPDGWWIGECRGRTGIFPATYVQVIH
ncbi:uncharacterized protein LOC128884722 [Hylaeus volcanicus]|uniref:uncharacterized protein LOC128884722 n=1 Tax=Hylaeus volcanicus TaxID=313075 RepID=UPI0023B7D927|nr:uncharacterized protein LOC128884722 [Hylaeus volcanicus]